MAKEDFSKEDEIKIMALNAAGHLAVQRTKLEHQVTADEVVEWAGKFESYLKGETNGH